MDGGEMFADAVRNSRPASRTRLIDEMEPIVVRDVSRLLEAIHDAPNRLPVLVDLPRDAGDGIAGSSARMTLSSFSPHTSYILWLHNSVQ